MKNGVLTLSYGRALSSNPVLHIVSFTSFRPDMTEKLLTGTLSLNTTNQPSLPNNRNKNM